MSNYCVFCETKRPSTGTNTLVLGDEWLEFCRPCGHSEKLTNSQTGETKSIIEVWKSLSGSDELLWEAD